MTYDEWGVHIIEAQEELVESLGLEHWDEVNPVVQANFMHKMSELWINYKLS